MDPGRGGGPNATPGGGPGIRGAWRDDDDDDENDLESFAPRAEPDPADLWLAGIVTHYVNIQSIFQIEHQVEILPLWYQLFDYLINYR